MNRQHQDVEMEEAEGHDAEQTNDSPPTICYYYSGPGATIKPIQNKFNPP
jgi:hypothetical protein